MRDSGLLGSWVRRFFSSILLANVIWRATPNRAIGTPSYCCCRLLQLRKTRRWTMTLNDL